MIERGNRRRWAASVALACLLTAVIAAGGPARARGPSTEVLGRGDYATNEQYPSLLGDERGDTAFVWQAPKGLRIALARPGAPFSLRRWIARRVSGGPIGAMDGHGDVVVAWDYSDNSTIVPELRGEGDCCDHVRVAMIEAGGAHVRFQTLTGPNTYADVRGVAISDDGTTVAIIYESTSRQALLRESWRAESRLYVSIAHFGRRFDRRVALPARQRHPVAIWVGHDRISALTQPEEFGYTKETRISPNGRIVGWRVLENLGRAMDAGSGPIFDRDGDEALLSTDVTGGRNERQALWLSTRERWDGSTRRVELLSATRPRESEAPWPWWSASLALAPDGRFLVAWSTRAGLSASEGWIQHDRPGRAVRVGGSRRDGAGLASLDAVAVDSRGQGALVATTARPPVGGARAEGDRLIVVFRDTSGRYRPPVVVSDTGAAVEEVAATIDSRGRGMLVWRQSGERIFARRFRAP